MVTCNCRDGRQCNCAEASAYDEARAIVARIAADLKALAQTETRGRWVVDGVGTVLWSAEPLPGVTQAVRLTITVCT